VLVTIRIVDNATESVYQYSGGAGRTSGNQNADSVFGLAGANTNPQGTADPPKPATLPGSATKTVPVNLPLAPPGQKEHNLFEHADGDFIGKSQMASITQDDSTWLDLQFDTDTDWLSLT